MDRANRIRSFISPAFVNHFVDRVSQCWPFLGVYGDLSIISSAALVNNNKLSTGFIFNTYGGYRLGEDWLIYWHYGNADRAGLVDHALPPMPRTIAR